METMKGNKNVGRPMGKEDELRQKLKPQLGLTMFYKPIKMKP